MSSSLALTTLRHSSRAYHEMLDSFGIAQALKQKSISKEIYGQWLAANASFLRGLEDHASHIELPEYLLPYFKLDYGPIRSDLEKLGVVEGPSFEFSPFMNADLWIIPIYTYLGSRHGMKMILNMIQKNQEEYPTQYLQQQIAMSHQWPVFIDTLSDHFEGISQEDLAHNTSLFWKELYHHYRKVFSS